MLSAEDVVRIHQLFIRHGFQIWINGGWGIDALLGEQTRPHKDLDFLVSVNDVVLSCAILGHAGYYLNWLWEENRWIWTIDGFHIPTAFVMEDIAGRQMDVHAVYFDDDGEGIPAWEGESGFTFSQTHSVTDGYVAGYQVKCFNVALQMQTHTGYALPPRQIKDMKLLSDRFGYGCKEVGQC